MLQNEAISRPGAVDAKVRAAEVLRYLRNASGYRADFVAARMGYGVSGWCLIESGKRSPSVEVLAKAAAFYGVNPSIFF